MSNFSLSNDHKKFPSSDETFIYLTFSLFSRLASTDKKISQQEIDFIERFMQKELNLDSIQRKNAIEIFRRAKSSSLSYEQILSSIKTTFSHSPPLLENLLEALVCLALADGRIQSAEETLLRSTARAFDLEYQYELIRNRLIFYFYAEDQEKRKNNQSYETQNDYKQSSFSTAEPNDAYAVLGVPRTSSDDDIRKQYRKLAKENHPDRLATNGLPKEFAKIATRRFQAIQEAYEKICKERGM
jgi:DnaJ like chaperone protein